MHVKPSFLPVILASSSPRRQMLFQFIGLPFEIVSSHVKEEPLDHETPEEYVVRLSRLKAIQVHGKIKNRIVVGADTVIELNGTIIGKPSSKDMAREMLKLLSGRKHNVLTGVSVICPGTPIASAMDKSLVIFKEINDHQVNQYVESGEPLGKAGAYAIQGQGLYLIKKWYGNYSNIVGLPVRLTQDLLRVVAGINIDTIKNYHD